MADATVHPESPSEKPVKPVVPTSGSGGASSRRQSRSWLSDDLLALPAFQMSTSQKLIATLGVVLMMFLLMLFVIAATLGGGVYVGNVIEGVAAAFVYATIHSINYSEYEHSVIFRPWTPQSVVVWALMGVISGYAMGVSSVELKKDEEDMNAGLLLCADFIYYCGYVILFAGMFAFHAHRDKRPEFFYVSSSWQFLNIIRRQPWGVVSTLAAYVYQAAVIIGTPVMIFAVQKKLTDAECKNSYCHFLAIASKALLGFMLFIACQPGNPIVLSFIMSCFTAMCMYCFIPALKKSIGEERWKFVLPLCFLLIELGQASLFLGLKYTDYTFYGLVLFQETYSLCRNLGILNMFFNRLMFCIGRGLSAESRDAQKGRLNVIAPSTNFGVALSPAMLLMLLAAEQLWEALHSAAIYDPDAVMPGYYKEPRIIFAWRNPVSALDTAIMLVVLQALRAFFYWLEVKVADAMRAYLKKKMGEGQRSSFYETEAHFNNPRKELNDFLLLLLTSKDVIIQKGMVVLFFVDCWILPIAMGFYGTYIHELKTTGNTVTPTPAPALTS